jgi:hypothetical protein
LPGWHLQATFACHAVSSGRPARMSVIGR